MKRTKLKGPLVASLMCLPLLLVLANAGDSSSAYMRVPQELDDLLAPIALYPDPLLAQMLPASTYPEELAYAAGWLRNGGDPTRIDEQNWDENVRAIAHYPKVLFMMADNLDWTASLGEAFLAQPADVTDSIQRLRWRAKDLGNLVSNDQQTVSAEGDYIEIVPAQPEYIYVPQYDTSVVYVHRWSQGFLPFITFGSGLAIGSWLDMDINWGHHHVFYHGWNRPGWVNHARRYIHIPNVYVQRSRPYINQAWRHDPSHGDPARYWTARPPGEAGGRHPHTPEVRGRRPAPTGTQGVIAVPGTNARQSSNRGRESLGTMSPRPAPQAPPITTRPALPAPTVTTRPAPQTPAVTTRPIRQAAPTVSPRPALQAPSVSPQPARQAPPAPAVSTRPVPPPPQPFGGYRGSDEARTQSMRGQESRQSSVGGHAPPSPAGRGSTPAHGTTRGGGRP